MPVRTATTSSVRRAALVTGCAGLVASVLLWVEGPGYPEGASAPELRRQVEESVDALVWGVAGQVLALGAFLLFLAALSSLVRAFEAPPRFWSELTTLSGTLVAVWLAVQASVAAIPLVLADDDGTLAAYPDGAVLALDPIGRLGETLGDVAGVPRGLLVLAVSVVVLRTRLVARWVGRAGVVVAVVCLLSVVASVAGLFAFALWLPLVSATVLVGALRRRLPEPGDAGS